MLFAYRFVRRSYSTRTAAFAGLLATQLLVASENALSPAHSTYHLVQKLIDFINSYFKRDLNWFFKQYFYRAEIPVLQTNIVFKKKKVIVKYKWKDVDQDFCLPVYFSDCNKKVYRLNPKISLSKNIGDFSTF